MSQEPLLYFYQLKKKKTPKPPKTPKQTRKEGKTASEESQRPLSFFAFWKGVFQQVREMYETGCVRLVNTCPLYCTNYIARTFQFRE